MAEYNPSKIVKDGNTYNFRDDTKIPLAGSNQISGSLIPATTDAYDLGNESYNFRSISAKLLTSNDDLNLYSSYNGIVVGSFLTLKKIDSTSSSGSFQLNAHTETEIKQFIGYPDGTLTWAGKNVAMQEDVVPRSGGAVMTGVFFGRNQNASELCLCGGTDNTLATNLSLFGKDAYSQYGLNGALRMTIRNANLNQAKTMFLYPSGTWTWDGTACQITSDQRLKQQISEIDDKLLDAWEDVDLVQFKYNDAVKEKSDNARLHTGYVVQQIDDACKKHNVDISKYGLYCHEEYAEETREVEQADGTKKTEVVRPASEHYSLRYTEALIVECAYLRKCIKELRTEIEQLKSSK